MKIRVFDTPHDAGIYVSALAEGVIERKKNPILGLATGSTPIPFYDALIRLHQCGLDFSQVTTINLDEYVGLDVSHPQSCAAFMWQYLFSHVNIPISKIHLPNGVATDLGAECLRYDEVIQENRINLQVLGIGVNGHIGFNEPSDMLLSQTHLVTLRPDTVRSNARFFHSMEAVPRRAVTMGVKAILQFEQIVLMAFGREKAEIVAKTVSGGVRTDIPASILHLHSDVTVVLDKESAGDLPVRDC